MLGSSGGALVFCAGSVRSGTCILARRPETLDCGPGVTGVNGAAPGFLDATLLDADFDTAARNSGNRRRNLGTATTLLECKHAHT
jgi:hypothetical protein